MKELDPLVFWAVFREMLGPWLYIILAVAVVATVLFLRSILQEHGLEARRLIWSQGRSWALSAGSPRSPSCSG